MTYWDIPMFWQAAVGSDLPGHLLILVIRMCWDHPNWQGDDLPPCALVKWSKKTRPFPGVRKRLMVFPQIALAIWGSYFKLGGEGSQILWDSLRGGAVTQCVVSRCNQGSGVCRSKRGLSRRVSLVSSHACTGRGSQYYLYIYILYYIYMYI